MYIEANPLYIKDPKFTRKINKALDLLQTRAPASYGNLVSCVGFIVSANRSGVRVKPGSGWDAREVTIEIAEPTFNASTKWLASVLAHESFHAVEILNDDLYSGVGSEQRAIAYQLMVLKQLRATHREITYLMLQKGDHFDLNKNGVFDREDYLLRDY